MNTDTAYEIGYQDALTGEQAAHVPFTSTEEELAYLDGLRDASNNLAMLAEQN